jgi:Protein tyrosine and serine/threonine kinase
VHSETRKFTHQELKDITNNFSRIIGRGGFGVVYHGYLENEAEVAVKVCSQGSGQGNKQFLAEVTQFNLINDLPIVTNCEDARPKSPYISIPVL